MAAIVAVSVPGCSLHHGTTSVTSPFPPGFSVAVAPILNFSGQFDLDPVQAADLLASEFGSVEGLAVLPVSRVVAALAAEGKSQIESPAHALRIADAIGADAIIVAGVTEYDAYTPIVGAAVQIYALQPGEVPTFDVVEASRAPRPLAVTEMADPLLPVGQIQKVYNASHDDVARAVRRYARSRNSDENPYGWRQYLKVQKLFLRFCWHDAIARLMKQQSRGSLVLADATVEDPNWIP